MNDEEIRAKLEPILDGNAGWLTCFYKDGVRFEMDTRWALTSRALAEMYGVKENPDVFTPLATGQSMSLYITIEQACFGAPLEFLSGPGEITRFLGAGWENLPPQLCKSR